MTNLSSTSNSQVFTVERRSIASRIRANFARTESESKILIEEEKVTKKIIQKIFNDNDYIPKQNIIEDIDLTEKRDKIPRTPVHK